ncbi:hypothetical protein HDU99_003183 [Rhizoclosmatium hyalinum]|nr:hypothetical protein HDU99_003183 [Rhizoclosmatium hyalinum]
MKNVRLYIILKSKKRLDAAMLTLINRITITVGILVELALLGYWVGGSNTGPLQVIVGTDAFDICSSVNKPSSVSIQVLEGYTIFVHCLLFVLAYMMKDVDQKFNEAPALSTIGVMNAVLFGVIMILPSNPTPSMDLIQCICIWIGTTLTLLILFGAKIYEVIFDTMSEKGLLKMSIKSTFDAGRSSAKSGFASSKMVSAVFVPAMPKAMKQDTSEHSQDSSNQEKSCKRFRILYNS